MKHTQLIRLFDHKALYSESISRSWYESDMAKQTERELDVDNAKLVRSSDGELQLQLSGHDSSSITSSRIESVKGVSGIGSAISKAAKGALEDVFDGVQEGEQMSLEDY